MSNNTVGYMPSTSQRALATFRKVPFLSMVFRQPDPRQQELLAILRQNPLFTELGELELLEISSLLHERSFLPNEIIFTEGEPGLCVYLIFKGEIEISKMDKNGKQHLARLGSGEFFGEVSFLDGSGRSASAIATVHAELIAFYRTELFELLKRKPTVASKVFFALARQLGVRLRASNQRIST